ncbi:MAG TPA: tetratricopeptide repeat protein [Bryobacteraceae bacterium]|jgi:tetratricopeptide (TPR) repeat protein|nr:tetratricopeptide repeat protein [Bryobacteraceae bacterium]
MRLRTILPAILCATAGLTGQTLAPTLAQAESLWKQHRYVESNDAFRALVAAHPRNAEYRVRWGRLFLERFNAPEASKLFNEALEIQPKRADALLGMALVAADGFEAQATHFARQALEADSHLVDAQELLARLALEDNNPAKAAEEAHKALAMSANATEAKAILATIDWLNDKPDTPWDPHEGAAYETAARIFVLNRRYEEGIKLFRKAIAAQPDLWSAHSQLGINLMRLGHEEEARTELELCYENQYRDAATVNTLRLMDSYKNFVTYKTDRTVLRLHKKEAELLHPYFEAEMLRALATYDKKYDFKLDRPVQVEVYPDHEDFAVRTMGMPGLGALGVTFGYVVAMDSPSGRPPGTFHWASTMWHEFSHVYVLNMTNFRVPRWFTEGLAVHEETAVSPEWGDRLDPHVIMAIKDKKLLPVAELDRGFVRPEYPTQVVVSYFEAGRMCDYIDREWGWPKLLAMIHDFAAGASTPEAIEKELGIKPEEFDRRFMAALTAETKKTVDGFDKWRDQLKEVAAEYKAHNYEDMIRDASAIRDTYPDYVETGNVYQFLADAYLAKGDKKIAIGQLERYAREGGRSPDTLKQLATLLEEAGNRKEAAEVLDRLNYIQPIDEDLHRRLGDLWLSLGNTAGAIREYQAVLAKAPTDPAASHFNLAKAYRTANRPDAAKDELLLSLESAPGFRPAQKMLLELSK